MSACSLTHVGFQANLRTKHRFPPSWNRHPFHKNEWRWHPKKRRDHKNSPILQYLHFLNYYS